MVWSIENANCNESKKIVWRVAPYLRGQGLDLGAGDFKVLPHVTSVDNMNHEQFGFSVKPDVRVKSCESMPIFASQSLDFVYSSHLLEHIENYKAALREWWRIVKQGGNLILYLPHKNFYPNIGQPGANRDHVHDFLPQDIINAMKEIGGSPFDLVVHEERNQNDEYSFLLVFRKISGKINRFSCDDPKPEKTALVCRFGAYGDLMMASSVVAGLKKQGYHVTLMCQPPGCDVVIRDPNIDDFMIMDRDQVPNGDLANFWAYQKTRYTKFVNLSETVEGTFLALPGRTLHNFTPAARHALSNFNYLEFAHKLAGVPHEPNVKFYATEDEKKWARAQRSKMGELVIMWSLAGSSAHKTWQGLDNIIASIMVHFPTAHVVLVGGPEGVILEAGWEKEARVHRTCGKWSIRQTLSFIAECDAIIGPETGVLNAACCEDVPKIVFLSHSTDENLTRDWKHTTSIWAEKTKCAGRGDNEAPACHQLHYGWTHCTRNEATGTAQCQADISIEEVWQAVYDAINFAKFRKSEAA